MKVPLKYTMNKPSSSYQKFHDGWMQQSAAGMDKKQRFHRMSNLLKLFLFRASSW